jgi:hypothetical protein
MNKGRNLKFDAHHVSYMNYYFKNIILAIFIIIFQQSALIASTLLEAIQNYYLEFSTNFSYKVELKSEGMEMEPALIKWKVWENEEGRRCQEWYDVKGTLLLYKEFGFDGERNIFSDPSRDRMIIKKNYMTAYHMDMYMRNPLYLPFAREFYFLDEYAKDNLYVPLFQQLKNNIVHAASVGNPIGTAKFTWTRSPLLRGDSLKFLLYKNIPNPNTEIGAASWLVIANKIGVDLPLAWERTRTKEGRLLRYRYEIFKIKEIVIGNKTIFYPAQAKLYFDLDGTVISEIVIEVNTLIANDADASGDILIDPSTASLIEDVDARTLIKVPK